MGALGPMASSMMSMMAPMPPPGMFPGMPGPSGEMPIVLADQRKLKLIEKVKAYQKCGDEHREAWISFVQSKYVDGRKGSRDPSRHDVATLQEFCRLNNLLSDEQ